MNTKLILLYALIIFTGYLIGKSIYFYKKNKVNPAAFLTAGNTKERILWSGLLIIFFLFATLMIVNAFSAGIGFPIVKENGIMDIAGIFLVIIGILVMGLAQYQMGTDWRMGNDEQGNIHLVHKGIFKRSRNPIYMSIVVLSLGIVVLLNSIPAGILWLGVIILFNEIIKTEEKFLTKKFGQAYIKYKQQVRRFI